MAVHCNLLGFSRDITFHYLLTCLPWPPRRYSKDREIIRPAPLTSCLSWPLFLIPQEPGFCPSGLEQIAFSLQWSSYIRKRVDQYSTLLTKCSILSFLHILSPASLCICVIYHCLSVSLSSSHLYVIIIYYNHTSIYLYIFVSIKCISVSTSMSLHQVPFCWNSLL